jgi:hypothetical protein
MQENQRLFKTTNWGSTPLGPTAGWPTELRAVIDTMLASRFPVSTAWGPQLHQIYDDAYNPMNGDKHPAAFGQPAREIWPEIRGVPRALAAARLGHRRAVDIPRRPVAARA